MNREFKIVYDSDDEDACSVASWDAHEAITQIFADLRECCNAKLEVYEKRIKELEDSAIETD